MAEQPDIHELFQSLIGSGANIKDVLAGIALTHPSLKAGKTAGQPMQTGLPEGPMGAAAGGMTPERAEMLRALLQSVMEARAAQGSPEAGAVGMAGAQPPAPAPPVVGRNVSPIVPRVTGMEQPLVLR